LNYGQLPKLEVARPWYWTLMIKSFADVGASKQNTDQVVIGDISPAPECLIVSMELAPMIM
jgi:hypothetical protein